MYRYVGLGESIAGIPMTDHEDAAFDAYAEQYALAWPEEERAEVRAALARRCQPSAEDGPAQLWVHEPDPPTAGRQATSRGRASAPSDDGDAGTDSEEAQQ